MAGKRNCWLGALSQGPQSSSSPLPPRDRERQRLPRVIPDPSWDPKMVWFCLIKAPPGSSQAGRSWGEHTIPSPSRQPFGIGSSAREQREAA